MWRPTRGRQSLAGGSDPSICRLPAVINARESENRLRTEELVEGPEVDCVRDAGVALLQANVA